MLRQFSNRHYLSKSYYTSEFPNKGTGCAKVLHSFFNEHRNQKGYWINELRSLGVFVSLGDEERTHENNNTRGNNEEKSTSEIQDIANYTEILKQAMYIEYKIAYDENGKEAQDIAPISGA